jgi:hypothetical protein
MAGQVVQLRPVEQDPVRQENVAAARREIHGRFHFWRGASGKRYVHTVFSLIECPRLPEATYILARREPDGRRRLLRIGQLTSDSPSLNLAEIRQRGATLGANEVHVHLLADAPEQRRVVELDLRAGQFASLSAEPGERAVG